MPLFNRARDKQLRPGSGVNIHRDTPAAEHQPMLDEGLGVGREYLQIGYLRVDANVRTEITPYLERPDIPDAAPEFMLAALAIGALPAIFDGAVEHAMEERNLVVEDTFDRVQGVMYSELGADHHEIEAHKQVARHIRAAARKSRSGRESSRSGRRGRRSPLTVPGPVE